MNYQYPPGVDERIRMTMCGQNEKEELTRQRPPWQAHASEAEHACKYFSLDLSEHAVQSKDMILFFGWRDPTPRRRRCQRSKFLLRRRERSPSFFEPATHDSTVIHLPRTVEFQAILGPRLLIFVIFVLPSPDQPGRTLWKRVSKWPIVKISPHFLADSNNSNRSQVRLKQVETVYNGT